MLLNISLNNPVFTLRDKIQEVSHDFLNNFGFNYFQYLRCYADGSIGLLTNDTSLFECYKYTNNSPVVFSSFQDQHVATHSYWFMWDEELPEEPVRMARDLCNLHNGITLVRRTKNYYDMIAVALPYEQENAAYFYLNKLKAIEEFINNFDKLNKPFINIMDKNPIGLPKLYRDSNYDKICLTSGRINVIGRHGQTYITTQELECLRLLSLKNSYKEIAAILNISPRSVETYIQRIKVRTGFNSNNDIERLLNQ